LNFCFFFFKEKEGDIIILCSFCLIKKNKKNQEKVIGQRARPDAAPLPFPAHAPLLVLVNRTENVSWFY